jgi:hypothetical protein
MKMSRSQTLLVLRGTNGSNPPSSSAESGANLILGLGSLTPPRAAGRHARRLLHARRGGGGGCLPPPRCRLP